MAPVGLAESLRNLTSDKSLLNPIKVTEGDLIVPSVHYLIMALLLFELLCLTIFSQSEAKNWYLYCVPLIIAIIASSLLEIGIRRSVRQIAFFLIGRGLFLFVFFFNCLNNDFLDLQNLLLPLVLLSKGMVFSLCLFEFNGICYIGWPDLKEIPFSNKCWIHQLEIADDEEEEEGKRKGKGKGEEEKYLNNTSAESESAQSVLMIHNKYSTYLSTSIVIMTLAWWGYLFLFWSIPYNLLVWLITCYWIFVLLYFPTFAWYEPRNGVWYRRWMGYFCLKNRTGKPLCIWGREETYTDKHGLQRKFSLLLQTTRSVNCSNYNKISSDFYATETNWTKLKNFYNVAEVGTYFARSLNVKFEKTYVNLEGTCRW